MKPSENTRIYEYDYIRALSALLIVLYHWTTRYEQSVGHLGSWTFFVPFGSRAVATFFILTGFFSVQTGSQNGLQFLAKRGARLYPAYWSCIPITSAFMFLLMPERLLSLKEILLNFTMVETLLGFPAVDGAYWSLTYELVFYFWVAVIFTRQSTKTQLFTCYLWMLFALIATALTNAGITHIVLSAFRIAFITPRVQQFLLGAGIALSQKLDQKQSVVPLFALCLLNDYLTANIWSALWCFVATLLIFLIASGILHFSLRPTSILHRSVCYFSSISYPVYLLHQFIGFSIIRCLELRGFRSPLLLFIPFLIILFLSSFVHKFIEIPAYRFLMQVIKNTAANKTKGVPNERSQ